MSWFHHKPKPDPVLEELKRIERLDEHIAKDLDELVRDFQPKLSFIKIKFNPIQGGSMAEGPVTLTVGQKTIASVDGFDQNGAPFTGPIPTPTWAIDNSALDTIVADPTTPGSEDVTSVAQGTANLTVTVTSAEGKVLTDTEVITNLAQAPVLSSVKINFSTPQ